jgi:hypothetical protein
MIMRAKAPSLKLAPMDTAFSGLTYHTGFFYGILLGCFVGGIEAS